MAPNGAGSCFFLLIQTLPTFWATRILILRIFIFLLDFLDPKFPDFQVNSEGFLAEVFHPWVRWEGPGSGFENSSGGAGGAGGAGAGGAQKSGFFQTPFFCGFLKN